VVRKRLETIGLLALERLAVESEPGENRTVDVGWPRGPVASCVLLLRSNGKRPRGNLSPPCEGGVGGGGQRAIRYVSSNVLVNKPAPFSHSLVIIP
jgi:hypothetical protein